MPTATTSATSSPTNRKHDKSRIVSKKLASAANSPSTRTLTNEPNSPLQPSRHANNHNIPSRMNGTVNDDVAEKAKRRKSGHYGELGVQSELNRSTNSTGKRVVSALAVQAQAQAAGGAQANKRAKRLSAVAPSAPVVSMEVMSTNFEEWMKLATDNKITANNTWNFALIDYFADLTLLRNGPDDQSINFQKASCTLDGCVKIWTSRVDSVATETGKLLSGLAGGSGADGEEQEGEEGDEEESGEPKATRKSTRTEATLAKSFAQLQIKKFDLEFTVDPLFKKTCADFDEGGAMGLLMNHLNVDGKGRVVFDAGDAGAEEDEEDDEVEAEEEMVDLDKLREYVPSVEATRELAISSTLSSFHFSSDPDSAPDFAALFGLKDTYNDDEPSSMIGGEEFDPFSAPTGETHDFFGDEDYDMGPPGGLDDGASMGGEDADGEDVFGAGSLAMAGRGESHGPFDPRRQGGQGELVVAFGTGNDDEGMFDYFDKGFGKAWAGAEHWKLRKVTRKDVGPSASTGAGKIARPAKQPFTIDFSAPASSATSSKTLFAPASKSSISLPSSRASSSRTSRKSTTSATKRREEWLLPDDMHFSSRQLLRLFLKPKFSLRMRRNASAARMAENANGEIDENFWAQAAADRADIGGGNDNGMDMDSQPIPFESQFFHDDGDDAFVDDMVDPAYPGTPLYPGDGEAEDLWQDTQGQELRKSKPTSVNFAKKAKRVDVKRLKDDIWTGLKALVPAEKPAELTSSSDEADEPTTPPAAEPVPVKTFDSIITSLRSSYPREKMSEISTSFCFICLLHLANEEGLRIETARFDGKEGQDVGYQGLIQPIEDDEEDEASLVPQSVRKTKSARMDLGERSDRIIGELQALKVYKDPNAGRAA